jgi:hypothetical protein
MMASGQTNPEFEIQIGEHGAETSVGIKPPVPEDELEQALSAIDGARPPRVLHMRPGGDPKDAYTLLEFMHPHFGAYRNTHALKVVEALKSALGTNGTNVKVVEEIKSLHGDHQLFE